MAAVVHREQQRMTAPWAWVLIGAFAIGAWIVFGGHLLFGLELGEPPPPWLEVVLLLLLGVALPWLLATFRLDIEVDDQELRFAVRPLLRRRILRADIERVEAVRYHPLRDYLGWGVRWMPGRGWAYTVRGDRGVRVQLRSGRTFLLGSERPEELVVALGGAA